MGDGSAYFFCFGIPIHLAVRTWRARAFLPVTTHLILLHAWWHFYSHKTNNNIIKTTTKSPKRACDEKRAKKAFLHRGSLGTVFLACAFLLKTRLHTCTLVGGSRHNIILVQTYLCKCMTRAHSYMSSYMNHYCYYYYVAVLIVIIRG